MSAPLFGLKKILDTGAEVGYKLFEGNGNPRAQGREGRDAITTRPSPAEAGRGVFSIKGKYTND